MKLPKGTIKRIHVDRRIMAQNAKDGTDTPPITVQTSKGSLKAHRVDGPNFSVVHAGEARGIRRLSCGARVWIETRGEIHVIG